MRTTICFISDFGLDDAWVGVCHAVIYEACDEVRVVDLSHQIPPFDKRKAAAVAAAGVRQLPEAIHMVVVDPGVGGARADLCVVTTGGTRMIGPDNGVLLPAANRNGGVREAFEISVKQLGVGEALPTFHARDVMAPAAAALACGTNPSELGPARDVDGLAPPPFPSARTEGGQVVAEIVDVDRFGSVRIGVGSDEVEPMGLSGDRIELGFGHLTLNVPMVETFSDVEVGEPCALIDSSGWLTLAVREGSASDRYGLEPGSSARAKSVP